MKWFPESQDRLPLTWWRGHPVYLAAVVALVGAATMVLTAILMAASPAAISAVGFSFENAFQKYYLWSIVTYVLVNPPSIWFVLSSFLLWRFGQQVEEHLGRRAFVKLLAGLLLITPLLLTLFGLAGNRGIWVSGMETLEFGVFLSFATLYPDARISLILVTIEAWILAVILVGVYALAHLAARDWPGVLTLAGVALVAHGFTRYEQGIWSWQGAPAQIFPKRKSKKKAGARPVAQSASKLNQPAKAKTPVRPSTAEPETNPVDRILEKIHREGLSSLSPEERRVMEDASKGLRREGS